MKRIEVKVPNEIYTYLWSRYLPETTFKTYALLAYFNANKINVKNTIKGLEKSEVKAESEVDMFRDEKERTLKSLGFDYPQTRQDDLKLLESFKLINTKKDDGEDVYKYVMPIPKPEDVLGIDDEEREMLQNLRFEISHQDAFNKILTLLLNSNNNIISTMEHISKTTQVSHSHIKEVLEYLVKEGSIKVKSDKSISELRKSDKVYLSIVQDVFSKKRMVLD